MNYLTEAAQRAARERRGLVYALRADGASFAEIGDLIGVSPERARAIFGGIQSEIYRRADRRFQLRKWVDLANLPPAKPPTPLLRELMRPARTAIEPPPGYVRGWVEDDGTPNPSLMGIAQETFSRFGFTSGFRFRGGPPRVSAIASWGPDGTCVAEVGLTDGARVLSLAEVVSAIVVECDRLNSIES